MIRREISVWNIDTGDGRTRTCQTPFSCRAEDADGTAVTLRSSVIIDDGEISGKHLFLKFSGIRRECEILINGHPLCEHDGTSESFTLEAKDALTVGENTLEICFADGDHAGIFNKVELIKTNYSVIDSITVTEKTDGDKVTLGIKIDTLGSLENVRAVATLVSSAGQIYYGGLTGGRGSIIVRDPLYWWPRGLGVQNLYKLTVNLYGDMEVEDTSEIRIGLRRITSDSRPDSPRIDVNGVTFLPMGAVFRYDARYEPTEERSYLEAFVASAARSGFNTLVVPADSMTPPESFYELCDLNGIVVIREIDSFNKYTASEIIHSSYHASFGLIDLTGMGERITEIAEKLNRINPALEFISHESAPVYPSFPSIATDKTISSILHEDERNLFSPHMENEGRENIVDMLIAASESYPYAKDLSDFAYLSRLTQANRIKDDMANARISRTAERAVFDCLTPDGALVSSSSIDSDARWKALQYYSSRFFDAVTAFAYANGTCVDFYVCSERRTELSGVLEYRILDSKNRLVLREEEAITLASMSSKRLRTRDFSDTVSGHENEYYLEYLVREGNSVLSRDTLLFVAPKAFIFEDPHIKAEVVGSDRRFSITLTADSFAKDVELDFTESDAIFFDNCFDVTVGAPIKISVNIVRGFDTAEHLQRTLKIRSLFDINH